MELRGRLKDDNEYGQEDSDESQDQMPSRAVIGLVDGSRFEGDIKFIKDDQDYI